MWSLNTLESVPQTVDVIQFGVYFILVKHYFQENRNELFIIWEMSFFIAALWLNMNQMEVI